MTIPAGVFGNVGPIQVLTERWHSPELKIVLESAAEPIRDWAM